MRNRGASSEGAALPWEILGRLAVGYHLLLGTALMAWLGWRLLRVIQIEAGERGRLTVVAMARRAARTARRRGEAVADRAAATDREGVLLGVPMRGFGLPAGRIAVRGRGPAAAEGDAGDEDPAGEADGRR